MKSKAIEIKNIERDNAYCWQCSYRDGRKKVGLPIGTRAVKLITYNGTNLICIKCAKELLQPIAEEFGWFEKEEEV